MRWWGWGDDAHAVDLPEAALSPLSERLGADPGVRARPVALEDVRVPEVSLAPATRGRL